MEDNKNKKVLNVPTLRFPEFNKNGAWTHKKIFDMGEIVTGTTPSTKVKEYYSNGKYLWVTPTDICGKEITTTNQKLTELGLKKGRKIQKNSILVTCIASIGKNCILREAGSCNQQINAIAVNNIHNIDFVYYLMENSVSMLHKYSSKGGMEILNKDVFSNLIVYTPNIDEQSKIANFLSLIDKRIELQNKIIKDYELLKKIINIRMFAHSTKLPILRFPEFNGGWEKTTLGNISNIKIYQPQTIKPLNFGKYKVFGANGYIGYYKECNHNTNQVTISCRGEKSGTVNFVEPFVWITGNSMVLNLDKTSEIIKKFLYYELISNNVNYLITGSGQPQLTRDSLIQHKIYFPNIDEQLKIANFLSKLDEVLLNVKCEKEKLIKNKTFLLQNLFI